MQGATSPPNRSTLLFAMLRTRRDTWPLGAKCGVPRLAGRVEPAAVTRGEATAAANAAATFPAATPDTPLSEGAPRSAARNVTADAAGVKPRAAAAPVGVTICAPAAAMGRKRTLGGPRAVPGDTAPAGAARAKQRHASQHEQSVGRSAARRDAPAVGSSRRRANCSCASATFLTDAEDAGRDGCMAAVLCCSNGTIFFFLEPRARRS